MGIVRRGLARLGLMKAERERITRFAKAEGKRVGKAVARETASELRRALSASKRELQRIKREVGRRRASRKIRGRSSRVSRRRGR